MLVYQRVSLCDLNILESSFIGGAEMMRINLEDINPNFGEHISSIVFGLEVVVVEVVCSIYFCSQWGGQEMMVDACLKMGYPKFPWVINVYHPFPPKEESIVLGAKNF